MMRTGALTYSRSYTTTKAYNEDGKTIEESDSWTEDYDGDGVADVADQQSAQWPTIVTAISQAKVARRQKMVATRLVSTKWPARTPYTDGLLTQTTVTETGQGETSYTLDFTYNDDGLVATKTKTSDNYVYRLAFTYDSEGRVVSYNHRKEDYDGDDNLNSVAGNSLHISYDASGRITESSRQRRYDNTPATSEYTDNEISTYTYNYTESGLVSSYSYIQEDDLDLNGEMDNVRKTDNYEFSYDNGSLVSISHDYEELGNDVVVGYQEEQAHTTEAFTYQDGLLKTSVQKSDEDNDGTTDAVKTTGNNLRWLQVKWAPMWRPIMMVTTTLLRKLKP